MDGQTPQLSFFGPSRMFSLQRLLSRGDRFFDLLEASAEEARQSVHALVELIGKPDDQQILQEFVSHRREDKRIREEINRLVCNTFITPLEREDIDRLSSVLSRIPKVMKKFAERLLMLRNYLEVDLFRKQAELLLEATNTLCAMVKQLRRHPRLDDIRVQNDRLHQLESEADKHIVSVLNDLYSGRYEALQMIVFRDLYELLEKVIDRCRDAGNVVFQIVLKYS